MVMLITAAFTDQLLTTTGTAPGSITFMPEGVHRIKCTRDGQPAKVTVLVTEAAVARLQRDLDARLKLPVRPFIDFNHENREASAIPKAFRWEAGRGIVLDLDWTEAGRAGVEGRTWSYFSPSFLLGRDFEPEGLPEHGAIGGLVNDPAFETIDRIAANRNTSDTSDTTMKDPLVQLGLLTEDEADQADAMRVARAKLKALRAGKAEDEYEAMLDDEDVNAGLDEDDVEAGNDDGDDDVEAGNDDDEDVNAELDEDVEAGADEDDLEALKAANAKLRAALHARRQREAKAIVASAIQARRIEPKNKAAQAYWLGELTSVRAKSAKAALLAITPAPSLTQRTVNAQRTRNPGDKDRRQNAAITAARAKFGKDAPFETVWEAAYAADPDAFVPDEVNA